MNNCNRNFSRAEMMTGLKAGRTLCVDRTDAPELRELLDLEEQGLVSSRVVEIDEQSTILQFNWKEEK